jgi:hypothetical protein
MMILIAMLGRPRSGRFEHLKTLTLNRLWIFEVVRYNIIVGSLLVYLLDGFLAF